MLRDVDYFIISTLCYVDSLSMLYFYSYSRPSTTSPCSLIGSHDQRYWQRIMNVVQRAARAFIALADTTFIFLCRAILSSDSSRLVFIQFRS